MSIERLQREYNKRIKAKREAAAKRKSKGSHFFVIKPRREYDSSTGNQKKA